MRMFKLSRHPARVRDLESDHPQRWIYTDVTDPRVKEAFTEIQSNFIGEIDLIQSIFSRRYIAELA